MLQATRIQFKHKHIDYKQNEVKAMDELREKILKVYPDDEKAFAYSRFYWEWETSKVGSSNLSC